MSRRETERLKETNPLQHWRLIRYWVCENHDLSHPELEFLMYLKGIEYFTLADFKTGQLLYNWSEFMFFEMTKRGWIIKVFKNNGRRGGHNRYATSRKFMLLYNRIYRILSKEEPIPESVARNKIMKRDTYTHKVYSNAIKRFNKE